MIIDPSESTAELIQSNSDILQLDLAKLQYCRNFEALVRRITELIRDSLEESQVLQTVTQELAQVLKATSCQIELYSTCRTTATVTYEYTTTSPQRLGSIRLLADFPEYQPLLQKQALHSVEIVPGWNPQLNVVTHLAYPIFDAREILGNVWVTRPTKEVFDEFELLLVEQVANQCAIAIRQFRLYQLAQTQVIELEKLDRLKKEFLRSLSRELRTPITSINLAAQTLESLLQQIGVTEIELVPQLLQILHNECHRESKLIDDLLTLTYLEADAEPKTPIIIELQTWLPPIVESFRERASCQRLKLHLSISRELPLLETDVTDLERIITELLNNACKFTPAGGAIAVSVSQKADTVLVSISNSGVEIAQNEISRIFEPFYRIPNNDPWRYGGSGLGANISA